ncbi:phosphoribosyl-AMP cyclohydrolase [Suttonella sp. R2A3]|uniref:phosphoribosyl-AMP cyclohydrolase n=1 Tax=Suttonella sp. R2A3 TaxID=2908648 RepID=UPI001F166FD0|nr:phosphoribosyl-AMP cyclohydrolase [Suttonella sp. R2A3]UJF23993.1 phosphoribosyl-AMP cyclohydrolase [Suttonella sp. R2A3]
MADWLDAVTFNDQGLVCVTAIDAHDNSVLMQAWMNREALEETVKHGEMVYYSRSRQRLWQKGESSGHTQRVLGLWLDCDGDAIIAKVDQRGGIACHTGHKSCFYRRLEDGEWLEESPVLKASEDIYGQ